VFIYIELKPENMIVVLRGHIRNSFDDERLYELIKYIYDNTTDLEIYIQTWILSYSGLSWRHIECKNVKIIDEEYIYSYFGELKHLIKKIIILNDNLINIKGNTIGGIGNTQVPIIGWKRYLYGKKEIISYLFNNLKLEDIVLNFRMDVFSNSNSFSKELIIEFIENNKNTKKFNKNLFIYNTTNIESNVISYGSNNIFNDPGNKSYCGIDNIYIGNVLTQFKTINYLYENLDYLIKKYDFITFQEYYFLIANEISNS